MGALHRKENAKIGSIQCLRAFSILAVLQSHSNYGNRRGDLGVDIFFVISGYLMARILSKAPITSHTIKDFYTKRIKRIVPAYLVLLLLVLLFSRFTLDEEQRATLSMDSILCLGFVETIYTDNDYFSAVAHLWTVSIEMQYYLVAPLIYFFLSRFRFAKRIVFFYSLIKISLILHWVSVCSIFCFFISKDDETELDILIVNFSAAAIIIFSQIGSDLNHRLFHFIGDISYSLYLVHFPIFSYFYISELTFKAFSDFILATFLSFLVAIVFHYSLEKYFIRAPNRRTFIFIGLMYFVITLVLLYDYNEGILLTITRENGSFMFEE
ncbi:unnamed protein product, partial [Mesorhabditis belari]|uniref:Acyltransferase 3 domain-containing protein n=1 Tax=Mesorhabditis belari TaxID=2138241 RepID=A0AAF3F7I1_9BILA